MPVSDMSCPATVTGQYESTDGLGLFRDDKILVTQVPNFDDGKARVTGYRLTSPIGEKRRFPANYARLVYASLRQILFLWPFR
jgi:hypothetical protein